MQLTILGDLLGLCQQSIQQLHHSATCIISASICPFFSKLLRHAQLHMKGRDFPHCLVILTISPFLACCLVSEKFEFEGLPTISEAIHDWRIRALDNLITVSTPRAPADMMRNRPQYYDPLTDRPLRLSRQERKCTSQLPGQGREPCTYNSQHPPGKNGGHLLHQGPNDTSNTSHDPSNGGSGGLNPTSGWQHNRPMNNFS